MNRLLTLSHGWFLGGCLALLLSLGLCPQAQAKQAQTTEARVNELIELLGRNATDLQAGAAYALGRMGKVASRATPALIRLLKAGDPQVVDFAADALGKVSAEGFVALFRALSDKRLHVRDAARRALSSVTRSWGKELHKHKPTTAPAKPK